MTTATLQRGTGLIDATAAKFGAAGRTTGMYGAPNALDFIYNGAAGILGTATIEAWFKVAAAPTGTKVIFGQDKIAWVGINTSGFITSTIGGGTPGVAVNLVGASNVCDGAWHHVALTLNAGKPSIYVDGTRIATSTTATAPIDNASTYVGLGIGGFGGAGNSSFDLTGQVDEVRVSRTLRYTGTTYTVPSAAFTPDTLTSGLWHFDADGTDSATTVAPGVPSITVGTSGTTDTITYTVAPAGTNTVAGYKLYSGTSPGAEVEVATNAAATAGSFTASNGGGVRYYYVKAYDSAATPNYSAASAETTTVVTLPTIGTISVAASGGTDTITYPAPVAGSFPIGGVSLYAGLFSGQESATPVATNNTAGAGTLTAPSPASGIKFYYVKAFDTAAPTPDYSNVSNEVTSGTTPAFAPNNAAIVYSPYTWDVTATRALAINEGAYFSTRLAGVPSGTTITLGFDVTNQPASNKTKIAYRLNTGAWTEVTLTASTVAVTIPAAFANFTSHLLEVVVKAVSLATDRWNAPYATAVKFTGITTSPNGSLVAPEKAKLNGLVIGDSITAGISTLGSTGDETTRTDATLSYAWALRTFVGCEVGIVGFGGQGVIKVGGGSSAVPNAQSTWNNIAASLPRTFTPAPDFVWINQGTNELGTSLTSGAFATGLTAILNGLIAATPYTTGIFVQRPFGGYPAATYFQAAIAACSNPARVQFVDTTGWWNTADSGDSVHPYGYIHQARLGPLTAGAIKTALGAGRAWVKTSSGVLKQLYAHRV